MYLTELEERVVAWLEEVEGLEVLKPSYPDFMVFNPKNKKFCFVEVKSRYDTTTYKQSQCIKFMKKLGFPVVVVRPEYDDDFLETMKKAMRIPRRLLYKEEEETK